MFGTLLDQSRMLFSHLSWLSNRLKLLGSIWPLLLMLTSFVVEPGTDTLAPGMPLEQPIASFVYTINHKSYGDIGEHTVTLAKQGDSLVVRARSRANVEVLFWRYDYESEHMEVWRDGRLVLFRSSTLDDDAKDDTPVLVTAHAVDEKLVVEGPAGRLETKGTVLSSHPWNHRILNQKEVMDTETGELLKIAVHPEGQEIIQATGRTIKTQRYLLSGGLERVLWFDEDGKCVQMRFEQRGEFVTATLAKATIYERDLLAKM